MFRHDSQMASRTYSKPLETKVQESKIDNIGKIDRKNKQL